MKPTWIVGIIAVLVICGLLLAFIFGVIPNPIAMLSADTPPSSEKCDFTEGQILDMLETIVGKELNNQEGIGYIRAMGMTACGTDQKTPTEILSYYDSCFNWWWDCCKADVWIQYNYYHW